ncbi:unnamed protein product [Adineta ricciae]|nr:unnamed protein product [Adineta ricciae]
MEEINVEYLDMNDAKDNIRTWQLIQTNPKTRLKAYFRFANKDAETFVKTINSCLSSTSTIEWRQHASQRSLGKSRNSEPAFSVGTSSSSQRMSSSRSCHALLPGNSRSLNRKSSHRRRSPSPIWKRRTTPVRKQATTMHRREKPITNSTDC